MSSIAPKSLFKPFSKSMTTRGYEPEQNDDLEAGKGVKGLKYQRIKVISTGVLQLGSSSGQGGSDHDTQGDVRDPGTTNQLGEHGTPTGHPTGQGGSDHEIEEGVVGPEAMISFEGHSIALAVQESVSEDAQQANNPDEDRKSALKLSLVVIGASCGGIYSFFSGLIGIKGQYRKPVLMACTLLLMVTMLSSVVSMGLAFTGSNKEWVIRILNKAKYISLVLLTLTGLTTGIAFLLSL